MRFVLADAYTATDELTGESQLNLLGDAAGTAFGVALETNASLTHLDLAPPLQGPDGSGHRLPICAHHVGEVKKGSP